MEENTGVYLGTNELVSESNIPFMIVTAYDMLQKSRSFWGVAMPLLQKAQRDLGAICVSEEMLDFKATYVSMVDEMKKLREISGNEDHTEQIEKPFKAY